MWIAIGLMAVSPAALYAQYSTASSIDALKRTLQTKAKPASHDAAGAAPSRIDARQVTLLPETTTLTKDRTEIGGGDTCDEATVIGSIPYRDGYQDSGTTCGFADDYDVACDWPASSPDVVYRYTASRTMLVDISLCAGSNYDTKLFVYEDDCESPAIACNEDYCTTPEYPEFAYVSALRGVEFWAGHTYYIVVDGYELECGHYTIDVTRYVPPPTCEDNPEIETLYGQSPHTPDDDWVALVSDEGAELGWRVYDNFSGSTGGINAVRWWGIEAYFDEDIQNWVPCERSLNTFEISFYGDDAQTPGQPASAPLLTYYVEADKTAKELLYGGFELMEYQIYFRPWQPVMGNWISIRALPDPGEEGCRFVWMSAEEGDGLCYQQSEGGELDAIGLDMSFCLQSTYERCLLECPPDAVPENEVCGEDTNGGCNMVEPAFTSIALGPTQEITVCGTLWAEDWWRDTDWYAVQVTEATQLEMTVTSEMPVIFGFVTTEPCGSTDCEDMFGYVWPGMWAMPCTERTVRQFECMPAGTYWLFVAPGIFSTYPCNPEGSNNYVMSVTGETCELVTGACCQLDGTCQEMAECQCEGYYAGDGMLCEDVDCPTIPPNDDCATAEVISLPALVLADTRLAGDDIVAPCGVWFGPANNVWYEVVGTGNIMTATTCNVGTEVFDTMISVFCASCENLLCVAGNDDDWGGCDRGFLSTVSWCSKKDAVYYITVGNYPWWTEPGMIELSVTDEGEPCIDEIGCPVGPPNNECASAQFIPELPASVEADIRLATDDEVPPCGDVTEIHQNVWYEVIGTGETMTATTCDEGTTVLDTAISVFCTSCDDGICVAGNNDAAACEQGAQLSSVSWCSQEGAVYYITVGSAVEFDSGVIQLDVTSDGASCTDPVECGDPPPEPGPVLLRGESYRSHGSYGSFFINLPVSGNPAIEPRQNGNWANMILRFDMDIEAEDGFFECGDEIYVTNGDCIAITPATDSLTIRMNFDRNACVYVEVNGVRTLGGGPALEGDNDIEVICHEGDVNQDGNVNVIDLQDIKNRIFQITTAKNFLYDVDVSGGTLNVIDLQETKNNLFTTVTCP